MSTDYRVTADYHFLHGTTSGRGAYTIYHIPYTVYRIVEPAAHSIVECSKEAAQYSTLAVQYTYGIL